MIENVLENFEDILLLADLPKLKNMWKTRFSIQFQYDGFDVDLLPAISLIGSNSQSASEQAYQVLQRIHDKKEKSYHYSSALAETQLSFMRTQSGFVHEVVRICKFWNKSLLIAEYVPGRSTLIELIAVYAGKKEESRSCIKERRSLLSAFNTFLKLMESFNNLQIEFDFDPLAPQRSINNFPWLKENKYLKETPFVIEPANPFNNLAKGVKEAQMKQFRTCASETLFRLNGYVTVSQFTQIPLDVIFEPQPTIHRYVSDDVAKFLKSMRCMVSSSINEGPSSPTMVIRKESKYKNHDMQDVLKHMQTVFSVISQGFVSSKYLIQSKTAIQVREELQQRITACIDVNIKGGKPRTWSSTSQLHEDQDITFSIPCYMMIDEKEEKFCVLISLSSE